MGALLLSAGIEARQPLIGETVHRSRAEELKSQLVWWQTPPDSTWAARGQHLEWLEYAVQVRS